MTTGLRLVLVCFSAASAALAGAPDVAESVKKLEARARKVVLDGNGLPVEVSLNNKPFADADLDLLQPFPGIKALDLTATQITDAGIKRLVADHPALETLQIALTKVTVARVKDLAGLKALRKLELGDGIVTDEMVRELKTHNLLHVWSAANRWTGGRPASPSEVENLELHFTKVTPAGLKEFAVCKKLNYLYYPRIDDATLRALAEAKLLHAFWLAYEGATWDRRPRNPADVRSFGLTRPNGVTAEGLKELAAFTGLQDLALYEFSCGPEALKVIGSFRSLETLRLGPSAGDAGLEELAALPRLQQVGLIGSGVTDAGLEKIGRIKALRQLDVRGARVTAAGLKHLAGLPLTSLAVSPGVLTDEALDYLADKKMLHALAIAKGRMGRPASAEDIYYMVLEGAPITDASVKHLTAMKSLFGVNLRGTRVTDKGVAQLKEALPNVQVTR
jgi:hypothetical protein